MADNTEEYELLPHKEIQELKEELQRLKDFEVTPSKKMHVSLLELNRKLDKLLTIFEDAAHEMRVEEGSLRFNDKMAPLLDRMNKIVEQNAELAQGILAVADLMKGEAGQAPTPPPAGLPPLKGHAPAMGTPDMPPGMTMPPGNPTPPSIVESAPPAPGPTPVGLEAAANAAGQGAPPLPPIPRRRNFGI